MTGGSMRFIEIRRAGRLVTEVLVAIALSAFAASAEAHKSSDAYLQLAVGPGSLTLRWDIALRDLDLELDLDANGDGKLSWGEIKQSLPRIEAYANSHISIRGCELRPTGNALERRNDGTYIVLFFESACDPGSVPSITYTLFSDVDPTHRGIAKVSRVGQDLVLLVLDPTASAAHGVQTVGVQGGQSASERRASSTTGNGQFLREGIHHILTGYDHVLFLLCLLLPAVLRRSERGWLPVSSLKSAVVPILGIVSAFTLAHSITLGLSALKIVALPASVIEPGIAMTIMLAALDNLVSLFPVRRVIVTFGFGLVHGFGFAGVLAELDLPIGQFVLALLEFNVGLELGQFLIVAAAIALLYRIRHWRFYGRVVVGCGSVAAFVLAALWFIERVWDVSILPFKV